MITIATGDLVGILSDVIPMASVEETLPQLNVVRLEWDGKQLHAQATDRYRLAWSTWDPADPPEQEYQPALDTEWGGTDDPWALSIGLDDAKHLVKTYKLTGKEGYYAPVTVELTGTAVKVIRSRDTGHSAITTVAPDRSKIDIGVFPDLRKLLSELDVAKPTKELDLNAKYLADFAKVRPRGPMHMTMTGPAKTVHISIGERFVGAIQPVRVGA